MSLVMSNNFEGAPGRPFLGDTVYSVNGNVGLVAGHYGNAVRFRAGVAGFMDHSFVAASVRVFSRIYHLTAAPSAHSQIFQARSATGAVFTISIRTTGQLALHAGGSISASLTYTPDPVPVNTDFRVVYLVDSTRFTAHIYTDLFSATPAQTITGTIPAGPLTAVREGSPAGMAGMDLDLSWPQDDNSTDPGPRQFVYMVVSSLSGVVPKTISATVHGENLPVAATTYSVDWGDGSSSGPQASNAFTHTFSKIGAWPMIPKVDVG